jgi:hypothetical protein
MGESKMKPVSLSNSVRPNNTGAFTRRAALGAGAAILAGAAVSASSARAAPATSSLKWLANHNPDDPEITIDYSNLRARLKDGVTWFADSIPPDVVKLSEIGNLSRVINFIKPNGDIAPVKIDFSTTQAQTLASQLSSTPESSDVLDTVVAVYNVAKDLGIFAVTNNGLAATSDSAILSGNIVFTTMRMLASRAMKRTLSSMVNSTGSIPSVSLNVSKLLLAPSPSSDLPCKQFDVSHVQPFDIPQYIFDNCPVNQQYQVTDDGKQVYSTTLDVKKLLYYSAAERDSRKAAARASSQGRGISWSDVATVAQAAAWILALADNQGNLTAQPAGIGGTISVSFSI